jgi:hypothetical protein
VADIQRTGNVYHGGFRQPEAAQNVFSHLKDALRRQNHNFVHENSVYFGLFKSGSQRTI